MAEKYWKAFLVYSSWKLEKVHDLIKLLNECKKISSRFDDLREECILLNDYYIETRYPLDSPVDYSKKEAREALAAAEHIGKLVLKNVK